jgi:hypothetical protein
LAASISGEFGFATGAAVTSAFTLSSIAVQPPRPDSTETAKQSAIPRSFLTIMPLSVYKMQATGRPNHQPVDLRFLIYAQHCGKLTGPTPTLGAYAAIFR